MCISSSNLESIDIQEESRKKAIPAIAPPIPYASIRFIPPYEIKTTKMVFNLKKGQDKIIWLRDYSTDNQDQKNLIETIQSYCENKYHQTKISVISSKRSDNDELQARK
jgi:hypothetical protein